MKVSIPRLAQREMISLVFPCLAVSRDKVGETSKLEGKQNILFFLEDYTLFNRGIKTNKETYLNKAQL